MTLRRQSVRERGSALIEFALLGIPVIFVFTSVMTVALDMWQYASLAYSTETTARYIVMHGRTCSQNGNSCTLTVGNIASFFDAQGVSLDPAAVNMTLKSAISTTTCNPLTSCSGNATQFPNSTENGLNFDVTVTATYAVSSPIAMFWPGASAVGAGNFTLMAKSRQRIIF
jgi:Flp pilus assembly protein TadG